MARRRYSGDLANPISVDEAAQAGINTGDWKEWLELQRAERIFMLLEHYQVDRKSPTRWFELAMALAIENVPCFSVRPKRGRPKKNKNTLAEIGGFLLKRKRGAPQKHTDASYAKLAKIVDRRKKELAASHQGRITDKAVLTDLLANLAKSENTTVARMLSEYLTHYQKLLSEARRRARNSDK